MENIVTPEQFDSEYLMAEVAAALNDTEIAGGAVTLEARYNDLEVVLVARINGTYIKRFVLDVEPTAPEPDDVYQTPITPVVDDEEWDEDDDE